MASVDWGHSKAASHEDPIRRCEAIRNRPKVHVIIILGAYAPALSIDDDKLDKE